jgi:hypothetical protein
MGRNRVQFQKGMSLAAFQDRYGTEKQCHDALVRLRWLDGFVCQACGGTSAAIMLKGSLSVFLLPQADIGQGRDRVS